LLALGTAVLAAHLLFLRAAPETVHVAPAKGRAFVMRSIAAPQRSAAAEAAQQPARLPPTPSAGAAPARTRAAGRKMAAPDSSGTAASPLAAPRIAAATPASPAAPVPPPLAYALAGPARLHYRVTASVRGHERSGQSELVWRHDGETYQASLVIGAGLLTWRTQRSTGRVTAEGLAPLRFSEKVRSEEAAHFLRDRGKVSFSSNRPDAQLLAGAQDRLSVLLHLGAMIAADPGNFPPGTTIVIQTAGTREADTSLFLVEGKEELLLPGGTVKALKLTRARRQEYDQRIELWLARTMDYVPVRLRLTQPNGDSVDQQWASTDRD
jgi:hypothetical protein